MITGVVNSRLEATVRISLRGDGRQIRRVTAVLNTGFSGSLTLPPELIAHLGLALDQRELLILADGSERPFDVYAGVVVWDRRQREILIHEADATPLVGTELLADYELSAAFRPRGKVTIKRLGRRLLRNAHQH